MDNVYIIKLTSIIIAIGAIIGNALVCHVIVRLKTMKTSINYVILNLAILDAMTGFITIYQVFTLDFRGVLGEPVLQQAYNQSALLADVLCKVEMSYWLPISISPLLLTIMAYERFKAIVFPFSRLDNTVTKARLKWMLPLAWIWGGAFVVAYMPGVKYDEKRCQYYDVAYNEVLPWYNVFWLIIQFFVPATAMLIFYGRVICTLRKRDKAHGPQAEAERARRKARKKVMMIIATVTLVFYICCGLPQVVYLVLEMHLQVNLHSKLMDDAILVPLAFNSAFNPLVYLIFMTSFRDGLRKVFMSRKTDFIHNSAIGLQHGLKRSIQFGNNKSKSEEHTTNANELQMVQDC